MTYVFVLRGVLFVAGFSAIALAQTSVISSHPPTGTIVSSGSSVSSGGFAIAGLGSLRPVAGHPFSAVEETQTVQTLADGTHITQGSQKVTYYRDSLGRTRSERTIMPPPGFLASEPPPVFIEIVDPVAGYRYSLDSKGRTAHRTQSLPVAKGTVTGSAARGGTLGFTPSLAQIQPTLAFRPGSSSAAPNTAQGPRPETSSVSLGTQNFEGVLAEGIRMTTTWPVGFFGNDRPITTVSETWTSRELGVTVMTKTSDPRSGESTMRLSNISQAEPEASLFQVPSDYQIVDPAGQTVQ